MWSGWWRKSKELFCNWEEWVREFDFPQKGGFYLFAKDPRTGLNTNNPNDLSPAPRKKMGFRTMRFMHHFMFLPGAPLYKAAHNFFSLIDGTKAEAPVTEVEYFMKFLTSRCRRCGDCTLAEMAFLCPQSQCAKFLFNGQCGGSHGRVVRGVSGEKEVHLCAGLRPIEILRRRKIFTRRLPPAAPLVSRPNLILGKLFPWTRSSRR